MKPTEQLKQEHKAIKIMLRVLSKVSDKLESGESVDPSHPEKIVDFIRNFADKCHHGKEEDLLFTAMVKAGVPKEGGPIGVMLVEHDQGRDYVKQMAQAAEALKAGSDGDSGKRFAQSARNYVSLLAQHIDKEDNILYQIADMHLTEDKQKELLQQFEKVEEEKTGAGKCNEYHALVHDFERAYLGD